MNLTEEARESGHGSRKQGDGTGRRRFWTALLIAVVLTGCASDKIHREGLDLMNAGRIEEGLAKLEQVAKDHPGNLSYRADLIRERDWAINRLLQNGDRARAEGRRDEAEANYRRVLKLDSRNAQANAGVASIEADRRHESLLKDARGLLEKNDLEGARERLQSILLENPGHADAAGLRRDVDQRIAQRKVSLGPELQSKFKKPVTLQFRDANLKMVFEAISRASGINIMLDRDVKGDAKTTIFMKDASVEDTIDLILMQNQLEKKVLNENSIFIYPSTPAKLKDYQDLVIRTFHFTNADAKQMQTMLKTMLKSKDIFVNEKTNSLVMRDTPEAVRLAEKLVTTQDLAEPEVMLEVEVLEVLRSKLDEMGIKWPTQVGLSITETPSESKATIGLGGVITTTTTPPKPLTLESLKGLNDSAIKVTPLTATIDLRKEMGDTNMLASPRIRVRDHEKAKILIGDRVPVITNSVTPVASGSPVVTGSVQYLDVGLKLEVEPEIHLDGDVAIKTFLEVSSIAREVANAASGTVAYEIGTRSTNTVLRLKDGETQVLAGLISDEDRKSASGVPGLGDMPILGRLFSSHKNDKRKTEIILSITPHIVRNMHRPEADLTEFWSGTDTTLRSKPLTLKPVSATETGASVAAVPAVLTASAPQAVQSPVPSEAASTPSQDTAERAPEPVAATPLILSWQGAAQARVGEQFKVALQAQTAVKVKSVISLIGFDPSALEVVEVAEGDFLKRGNAQTVFGNDVDQAGGQIVMDISLSGEEGMTGKGSIAIVTFKVKAAQSPSMITVSSTASLGVSGEPLPVTLPPVHSVTLAP